MYVIFPAREVVKRLRFLLWIQLNVLNERSVAADVIGAERIRAATTAKSLPEKKIFHHISGFILLTDSQMKA